MRTVILIPARHASTRLPGKPLLKETGKYLIQHVYERACQSTAAEVVVATDDMRIFKAVGEFGGKAVMTRSDHTTGTDRIAEAARDLEADVIVNLQGDEPLVESIGVVVDGDHNQALARSGGTNHGCIFCGDIQNVDHLVPIDPFRNAWLNVWNARYFSSL